MQIEYSSASGKARIAQETTVVFAVKEERASLPVTLSEREFSGATGQSVLFHERNLLIVGVGEKIGLDAERYRRAAGAAISALKKTGRTAVGFDLRTVPQFAAAAVEGAILADYRFDEFRKERVPVIGKLRLRFANASQIKAVRAACQRAITVARAVNTARHLNNQPANLFYPQTLEAKARQLARTHKLKVTVLDEKKLAAGKFGGILAVGSGSRRPPRLIVLEHRGGPAGQPPVALVGKAVTFDTGGISLKPAQSMELMVFDKSGGLSVLGTMCAIARLGIKQNVVGIIPAAENMPGGTAYRPGDIVTTYDGKTVEIVNTDAEGRLLLVDAIAYARKVKKARVIVDLATLTGACGVALGKTMAGLWSSAPELREQLIRAAEVTGERLWPMPLEREYDEMIASDVALLKNSGGRMAGASTAAAFLKAFAEKTPWAHLDIAYSAFHERDQPHIGRGASGYGIRTLVEWIDQLL